MSDDKNQGIKESPLFVGLTRPTELFGLSLDAFIVNLLIIAIVFLISKNLFLLLLGVPSHYFLKFLTSKDVHIFSNLKLHGFTKGQCREKRFNSVHFSNAPIRKIKIHEPYKEI